MLYLCASCGYERETDRQRHRQCQSCYDASRKRARQATLRCSIASPAISPRRKQLFPTRRPFVLNKDRVIPLNPNISISAAKANARAYANAYKRKGLLKEERCRVCGDTNAQMHHHDYTKPLDVDWLCKRCHLEHHNVESQLNKMDWTRADRQEEIDECDCPRCLREALVSRANG